ncbi:MAG: ATP-binding protein [Desulfobacterota bacterium]|nr:ATP-binding protein [Thermodesulfobacteriota bacterium]
MIPYTTTEQACDWLPLAGRQRDTMRQRNTNHIKIWAITALIIAGIGAVSALSFRMLIKNTAEAFNTQQLFLVRESSRGIVEFMRNVETGLRTAADLVANFPKDTSLHACFAHYQGLLHAFFVMSANGRMITSEPAGAVDPGIGGVLHRHIANAVADKRDLFCSQIMPVVSGGKRDISFVMGVAVPGKSLWVCGIINFTAIKERLIYPLRSGKTGYAWMIDKDGVLLAHPNVAMEGRKAIDVLRELWPEYSSFNLEIIINRAMTRGEEGKGEYTGWHFGEKRLTKKLIAYSPVKLNGMLWSIGVSAPYREALEPVMQSSFGPLIFLLFFIAIIVLGAWFITLQERRKAVVNQELAWSNEVFDGIADGISIIDREYRVLLVNRTVAEWHGKSKAQFRGLPCYKVYLEQDGPCYGCPARDTFATGQPAFRDRVSMVLNGRKYYFQITTFPLKDTQGATIRVAECVKDITRETALQQELLQHERKSMIVKMSSQIAHEIRNPLGSLTLNIDLLEEEISACSAGDVSEARRLIGTIKSEIDGLNRVLKEYLECTRFPAVEPALHDVNRIIEDLFGLLEEELRRKKIIFATSLHYNLPQALVDRDQIRRAFLNIVLNAVEAMPGGGTIQVTTRTQGAWIEILFSDTGPGIPEAIMERIFTPFFTTKSGGTGLGLSIAQHIIAEHKGEIVCESKEGQGACFIVRIPFRAAHEA